MYKLPQLRFKGLNLFKLTAFFLLTFNLTLSAGPMSGTFTIGSAPFPTINSAVDSLLANGVGGPVIFNIPSGTYTEQIRIPEITGTSSVNTITFQAETIGEDNVILDFAATHMDTNYIIRLDSVAYLNLIGLTFTPNGTEYRNCVEIRGSSSHITIDGNFFKSPIENKGQQIYVLSEKDFPSDNVISEIIIMNNHFYGGAAGIQNVKSFGGADSNFIINNNDFSFHGSYGVYVWSVDNFTSYKNTFNNNLVATAYFINEYKGEYKIYNNRLNTIFGFSISNSIPLIEKDDKVYIFNNIVKCEAHSLTAINSNHLKIQSNTLINKHSSVFSLATLKFANCDSLNIQDNIIQNFSQGTAIGIDSPSVEISINSNIYHTEGDTMFRYQDEKFTSLVDWQNVTLSGTRDPNSAVSELEFLDSTNYNLVKCNTDPLLEHSSFGAILAPEITNDIHGVMRDPVKSWPGAAELMIDEGKIVKVSGFVAQGTDTLKAGTLVAYVDSSDRQLLDQVGETTINEDGSFVFESVPALPMWIRIYPEDTNYLTSYHDSVIRKSQSTPLSLANCDGLQTDIFPRRIYPFEFDGLGTIEGYVTYADLSSSKVAGKDPIPGLDVVLDRIPPSKSIKVTITDDENFYSFSGLPDGTYSVTIEYEGLDADTIYKIDVVSSDPTNTGKNYCIDTTRAITDCLPPESLNELDAGLKIFPNPFNNQLNIQTEIPIDRVRILDLRGVVILDEKLTENNASINTSYLVPSVYFVEIFYENESIIKKVIKQ